MRDLVLYGDCLARLKEVPSESVQTCVTSPPYLGLRDYGAEGQVGLEETPAEYVAKLVEVFREVRRVLRNDGTLWLNIGDSYAANRSYQVTPTKWKSLDFGSSNAAKVPPGLKPKDLMGVPWRVALALQDDGWWLRSDVIWDKPTCQPESVHDRPTRSHEYVFLLTKSETYFYDAHAIREASVADDEGVGFRNKRTVWRIQSRPYKGAHFAVFPPELPRTCIMAGSSERGACSACGAPWLRVVERPARPVVRSNVGVNEKDGLTAEDGMERTGMSHFKYNEWLKANPPKMIGWKAGCTCEAGVVPCLVLDPFAGSGTTLAVAVEQGRSYLGCELNESYKPLIEARLSPEVNAAQGRDVFEMLEGMGD